MPILDFPPASFTKPLEAMLEAKYPLKSKNLYVLQMDNPYLILNPLAFEAAGISEEDAENTTKTMLEQIFSGFAHTATAPAIGRLPEPPILTHVFTLTQMREGRLPDTQYGRLVAHSYSPRTSAGVFTSTSGSLPISVEGYRHDPFFS